MQIKFLKKIVENLTNKEAAAIVDLLAGKKDINEFLIAKKLGLTINQTRNILYKLSDFGLVSSTRKKDKRKGWFIYFWTLNTLKSLNLLEQKLNEELAQLEVQLKNREEKRFYFCKTCNLEINEENALLNDFACPECEEVYILSDNAPIIQNLEHEILKLKKELKIVTEEKTIEETASNKKKTRKIKRTEALKKSNRKRARKLKKILKPKKKKKKQ